MTGLGAGDRLKRQRQFDGMHVAAAAHPCDQHNCDYGDRPYGGLVVIERSVGERTRGRTLNPPSSQCQPGNKESGGGPTDYRTALEGTQLLRQADLFDRAEDCERAFSAAGDPEARAVLKILRDMWIALANESSGLSQASLAKEVAAVEELQSALVGK